MAFVRAFIKKAKYHRDPTGKLFKLELLVIVEDDSFTIPFQYFFTIADTALDRLLALPPPARKNAFWRYLRPKVKRLYVHWRDHVMALRPKPIQELTPAEIDAEFGEITSL